MRPHERAYAMKPKGGGKDVTKGTGEAKAQAKSPDKAQDRKTKRKTGPVERMMNAIGMVKAGTFRREQLQVEMLVSVLRRFCKMHSDMVRSRHTATHRS